MYVLVDEHNISVDGLFGRDTGEDHRSSRDVRKELFSIGSASAGAVVLLKEKNSRQNLSRILRV